MKILIISIMFTILVGCEEKSHYKPDKLQAQESPTPEVLSGNSKDIYNYKRGPSDIVAKLYKEALESQKELEKLNNRIKEIRSTKKDSLASYLNYTRTNKEYWSSVNKYINRIKDSSLRESTQKLFKKKEDQYDNMVLNHEQKLKKLDMLNTSLADHTNLLKLNVSLKMMQNYQNNELPKSKTLDNLIQDYENLIKDIEGFK